MFNKILYVLAYIVDWLHHRLVRACDKRMVKLPPHAMRAAGERSELTLSLIEANHKATDLELKLQSAAFWSAFGVDDSDRAKDPDTHEIRIALSGGDDFT